MGYDSPMVSIICNAYNHDKYIRSALDGFVMQKTNFPFLVLIHDDASTDKTADIIKEYESKYPDIIKPIYQTENQYHKKDGTIRRLQAERLKTKYVAICEGDDYWTDPLKLQKQFDFMEANPEYTLCGCSTYWLNMLTGKNENRSQTTEDRDISLEELLIPDNRRPFPTVSYFMKAEIWKSLPDWGFPVGDLPLTYYCAIKGKVRMLTDNMCVYRWQAEGSWTSRNFDAKKRAEVCDKMIAGVERMNADTNYEFDELCKRKVTALKYTRALMRHDFKAIKSPELIGIYKKRDFIHRFSDWSRCTFPGLYKVVQNILGRKG